MIPPSSSPSTRSRSKTTPDEATSSATATPTHATKKRKKIDAVCNATNNKERHTLTTGINRKRPRRLPICNKNKNSKNNKNKTAPIEEKTKKKCKSTSNEKSSKKRNQQQQQQKKKQPRQRLLELTQALRYNVNRRRVMSHIEVDSEPTTIKKRRKGSTSASTKSTSNTAAAAAGGAGKSNSTLDIFHQRYNELLAFKESYGHCNVPYEYNGSGLARWCKKQVRLCDCDCGCIRWPSSSTDASTGWKKIYPTNVHM